MTKMKISRTTTKKKSSLSRCGAAALHAMAATALMATVPMLTLAPIHAFAQSAPKQRTADGRVLDKGGKPVSGAVVYLKDSKSNSVKTFICGDDGTFHFGQLSQNNDYELWAEISGHRSKNKSISSFDSKNSFQFTLTIDM